MHQPGYPPELSLPSGAREISSRLRLLRAGTPGEKVELPSQKGAEPLGDCRELL